MTGFLSIEHFIFYHLLTACIMLIYDKHVNIFVSQRSSGFLIFSALFSQMLACNLFQIKNNSVPTYYTNRALCYLKLKKWEDAIKDCKRALELDSTAVKGHYFLGEAYMEQSMYDESIKNLTKGK